MYSQQWIWEQFFKIFYGQQTPWAAVFTMSNFWFSLLSLFCLLPPQHNPFKSRLCCFIEDHHLATNWTAFTSLHPFINATKVKMMRAFGHYLGVLRSIFFKTGRTNILLFWWCINIHNSSSSFCWWELKWGLRTVVFWSIFTCRFIPFVSWI